MLEENKKYKSIIEYLEIFLLSEIIKYDDSDNELIKAQVEEDKYILNELYKLRSVIK